VARHYTVSGILGGLSVVIRVWKLVNYSNRFDEKTLFEKGAASLNRFEKIWVFFINRLKFLFSIILSFVKTEYRQTVTAKVKTK
jgi:hypothetical protein